MHLKLHKILVVLARLASLFHTGVFLAVVGSLLGFCGSWYWLIDLFSHFRLVYGLAIGLGVLLALGQKQRRLAALWAVGFLINAVPVAGLFLPSSAVAAPQARPLRLMFVNVLRKNPDKTRAIDAMIKADPDVIVAVEVDHLWGGAMQQALAERWPHGKVADRSDNFGVAIFSKIPMDQIDVFESPGNYVPSLRAEITVGSQKTVVYGTHPFPPMSGFTHQGWQIHMADLARRIQAERLPVILTGDFNSTPWSANYRWFVSQTGLVDSQQGFGPQPSWPTELPYLGIPIDHVLTSKSIRTERRRIGTWNGSDHRPVIADLLVPN
jgi:endonuclease/exonuclease/phosphatase (EEP) superfamily protein YafD